MIVSVLFYYNFKFFFSLLSIFFLVLFGGPTTIFGNSLLSFDNNKYDKNDKNNYSR